MPIFSVRETTEGIKKANEPGTFDTIITIDFFYIQTIDKKDAHQLAQLEEELNLPLGKGCSEFLEPIKPQLAHNYKSFMMTYVKASTSALVSLAYDHEFGYLREEKHGQSVKIWDLNEDLLYHSDYSMDVKLEGANSVEVNLEPCSVIKFEDQPKTEATAQQGGQAGLSRYLERPYELAGDSLDVLKFLGADTIYYMGQSTVRDMPCLVFETILSKPPKIFQVDIQDQDMQAGNYDYIVQFYVFKTIDDNKASSGDGGGNAWSPTSGQLDHFWPAKINLYSRHKEAAWRHLHESLDVQDFHWGLYGWQGKPSELFMMPECFSDEDEQLKIELALDFKATTPARRQSLLARYKYKLEMDLQTKLFKLFGISRLHLTEYRLTLQRHNMLASMVISDRKEEKKLSYFGAGQLPNDDAFKDHKILLSTAEATSSTEGCIMYASHLSGISMVIYCPAKQDELKPTCTAIFNEAEPEIQLTTAKPGSSSLVAPNAAATCQTFRFEPNEPPRAATHDLDSFNNLLTDYKFNFELTDDTTSDGRSEDGQKTSQGKPLEVVEVVEVSVEDFDITREQQLILISNYKFALPEQGESEVKVNEDDAEQESKANVRYFPSISYDTLGDCSRMCNLDSSCKSYSFCPNRQAESGDRKCLLSSLDLRQNKVEHQLVEAMLDANLQISIVDHELANSNSTGAIYKFSLKSGCNIYERDFLSMFSRTDETLRINPAVAKQFPAISSATECARYVAELEEKEESHHAAAFAYCAHTGTCLSDSNMFGQIRGVSSGSVADEEEDESLQKAKELTCQMYRKRYQTYFHVSPMVVKRPLELTGGANGTEGGAHILSGGIRQLPLELNTVEDCARACWDPFGHVCVSFDFCSPGQCLINAGGQLDTSATSTVRYEPGAVQYESRDGCLAYKRDLKWDQLRRDHLIGKHTLLNVDPLHPEETKSSHAWGWFLNLLLVCAIVVLFEVGLIIGQNFNDRWENTRGFRRSNLTESTRNLTPFFREGSVASRQVAPRKTERMSSQSKFNIENEIYEDASAIRMEEFGNRSGSTTPTTNSRDQTDRPPASNEVVADDLLRHEPQERAPVARPVSRRPNYIDVPDLL